MTQPSLPPDKSGGYQVDLDVMRRDAASWEAAEGEVSGALSAARGAALSPSDWSWVGGDTGLTQAYSAAHQWAVGLLEGAASNCAGLSQALYDAADQYEAQETATTGKLKGIDTDGGN